MTERRAPPARPRLQGTLTARPDDRRPILRRPNAKYFERDVAAAEQARRQSEAIARNVDAVASGRMLASKLCMEIADSGDAGLAVTALIECVRAHGLASPVTAAFVTELGRRASR
jgi:hypothetical protein